jgi:hypothetical protein
MSLNWLGHAASSWFWGFKEPGHTGKFGTGDPFDGQLVSWDSDKRDCHSCAFKTL